MIRLRLTTPAGLLALGMALLSGCDRPPPSAQAQADAATRAACERRANQAYDLQNRDQIYSPQSQVNTPYSANYTPDVSNRGLSDLFVHDRMVSDCVRNTGTGTDRTPPGTPAPAAATVPPPPPPRR
ncbi:MAG TPA: hypothetical protein VGC09_13400 [Rhodopila sp.]